MTQLLPSASIWEQFTVIGVLVLVIALLGIGAEKLFEKITKWQTELDKQHAELDNQRAEEQEKQRVWEEAREAKLDREMRERNATWQEFFKKINDDNVKAINQMTTVYGKLVEQIDCVLQGMQSLTSKVDNHDQFAKKGLEELKKAKGYREKTL